MKRFALQILVLALIFGLSHSVFGQSFTIAGKVVDEYGTPLAGANILVADHNTGAAADESGEFKIPGLKSGFYKLEVSMVGFKRKVITGIQLISKSVFLNVVLRAKSIESELVIVSAGKYEQKMRELPISASVIQPQQFLSRNYYDIEDAMRYVPGVMMNLDQVSIRGANGYSRGAGTRVLLAIDGIPMFTGDTGEIIWGGIPVHEVDRVEVVKGASSALYGSAAIGGVINIVTRKTAEKPFTLVRSHFGFYDKPYFKQWDWSGGMRSFNGLTVAHSNKFGKLGATISLTRLENSHYKQSGFYHRYIGYMKLNYSFTPASSLTVFANTYNKSSGNFIYWKDLQNALVPPDADQGQRINSDRYMFGALFNSVLSPSSSINFRASYYRNKWVDQSSSANSSSSDVFRGEVQYNHSLSQNLFWVSGAEAVFGKVNSNIFGSPESISYGAYSQLDYQFTAPLKATIGVRYDLTKLDSLSGISAFSPKLGLTYEVSPDLILRSSIGTGFRAPTLAEAFTTTVVSGITIKPNPNLGPEHAVNFELGMKYRLTEYWNIDAAFFDNEYYDFIEAGVDPSDGKITFSNVTRARIQGAEINSTFSLFNKTLDLSLNYNYLWARDIEMNRALKYRPRNLIYASAAYTFEDIDFSADFRYWSRVEEIDTELVDLGLVPDGEERVEVFVLDLSAGYNFLHLGYPVKAYVNVKNALNYNYVEMIGNLAPIRNYSLNLDWAF